MTMIKTIAKIGNSHGIIFDSTLLQLARLKPGSHVLTATDQRNGGRHEVTIRVEER